jgi:hypothetical protein
VFYVTYDTPANYSTPDPTINDLPFHRQLAAWVMATGSRALTAATATVNGDTAVVDATSIAVTVDCLDIGLSRNVTCGPGYEGRTVTYACPTIKNVPVCAFWDTELKVWSTRGVEVLSATEEGIHCTTGHLTDFAARFSALLQTNEEIFANASVWTAPRVLFKYAWTFVCIGAFGGLVLVSCPVEALDPK